MRTKFVVAVVAVSIPAAFFIGTASGWRPAEPASTQSVARVVSNSPSDVLATVAGKSIMADEVDGRLGNLLLRQRVDEYKQRREVLRDLISNRLLESEAERRHTTVKDLLQAEVEQKIRPVSDEEANAVYESAAGRFGNAPSTDALRSISESMRRNGL